MAVLNSRNLKELYALMMKSRILAEQTSGTGSKHTIAGFEATLVGAGAHLQTPDCVTMDHSGAVVSLIKGTPLASIFAGTQAERNRPMGDVEPGMPRVVEKVREMKGKGSVMLMFCPHNSETLVFEREVMSLVAKEKLPLVCLVEKSFNSEEVDPPQSIAPGKKSAFYPTIAVDGGDAVAVFRVTQEAIRRAREGHGPTLIECFTSRASKENHKTFESSLAQDPLIFMEQYLRKRKLWSNQWSQKIADTFTRELKDALSSPTQGAQIPLDHGDSGGVNNSLRPAKISSPQEDISVLP